MLMVLLYSVALSILVALALHGRLSGLAHIPFRLGGLTFGAMALQVVAVYAREPTWLPGMLLIASYVLLLVVVAANARIPGVPLIGLGLVANMVVIAANGGYMPVTPEAILRAGLEDMVTQTDAGALVLGSKDIVLPRYQTRLWMLGDFVVLDKPYPSILSVGDLMLAVGAFWFILANASRPAPQERTTQPTDEPRAARARPIKSD